MQYARRKKWRALSKKAAADGQAKAERKVGRVRGEKEQRGFAAPRNGSRERDRDVEEAEFRSLKDLAVGSSAPAVEVSTEAHVPA